MSETIYLQVEHAIGNQLHLGRKRPGDWRGMTWDRPVRIHLGDIWITPSDCSFLDPHPITPKEWEDRVERFGLWQQVGLWKFVRYPNPAANVIRYCEQYPIAAGEELYRLRQMAKSKT